MNSLRMRLMVGASVVLAAFLGLTGLALERAFQQTGLELVRDTLRAQVYALLASAESGERGALTLPDALPEPRFAVPSSGLYARVLDGEGAVVWRSQSLLDRDPPLPVPAQPGIEMFTELDRDTREPLFALGYQVLWEQPAGPTRAFIIQVAENRSVFDRRLRRFRRNLWSWLGAAALVLLASQVLLLTWTLRPLRRLETQIAGIERGEATRVDTRLPRELASLADRMNQLIDTGRTRLERHRNALADLAHALKTPLAVLRSSAEADVALPEGLRDTILGTVDQLDQSIAYHLRRATAAGESPLAPRTELMGLAARLRDTMLKVHHGRGLRIDIEGPATLQFQIEPGDFLEVLGNLLDNACKWANRRVVVELAGSARGLEMRVHDDGPGIALEDRERVLARGVRVDERVPGHGIGLAVVRDVVEGLYGGRVSIGSSASGGANLTVALPSPRTPR